ncbi:TonB-dependent receptor family protein [Robertkochia solimangrovi]|uniref:TonB-dependent receptor family protein n=1 Tax=Robertkochia solimangrovi TaxID=2213046 RepID=UPI0011815094|nr:TonB-dependent receptor [Robertkochia solimangrovi]TRZ45830.1 TonB-dependent receptor [Robertkochia solimangrovi]
MRTVILLLFLILSPQLFSQETIKDTLKEVILETGRTKKLNDFIRPTSIDTLFLKANPPFDLSTNLNQVPGVLAQSGGPGVTRLSIRGIGTRNPYGTNRIRAYFNGFLITNGSGITEFEIYDPESLQNFSVLKGPESSRYGANLGGVLILETTAPLQETTTLKDNVTAGSFGMLKNSLQLSHQAGNEELYLLYDHLQSDGFRQNSRYERDNILFNYNHKITRNQKIGVMVNHILNYAEIPSSLNYEDYRNNPEKAASNWYAAAGHEDNSYLQTGISHEIRFSENLVLYSNAFYTYLDHYEPRPFNILDETSNGYGFRSELLYTHRLNRATLLINSGMAYNADEYSWKTIENLYEENPDNESLEGTLLSKNKEYRKRMDLFASTQLDLAKFRFKIGLNLTDVNYRYRDHFNTGEANLNSNNDFAPVLSPSAGIKYRVSENFNFSGAVSKGTSFPGLEETLTQDGRVNPELKPETGISYELEAHFNDRSNTLNIDASVYYMDVKNLLIADRIGEDQYIGRNAGKTSHKGIEFNFRYRLEASEDISILPFMNLSLNHYRFTDFVNEGIDYSGNKLTGTPSTVVSTGFLMQLYNKFNLDLTSLYQGKAPVNDANTVYNEAYTIVNIKATYNPNFKGRIKLEITGGINNLFDKKYASSFVVNATGFGGSASRYYYPGQPINYYGGLRLNYKFN